MGIRVTPKPTKELQAGNKRDQAQTTADGYFDRIVKYIPSQVITFYTAAIVWMANPNAPTTGGQTSPAGTTTVPAVTGGGMELWLVFVAGLALTIFLTYWQTRDSGNKPAPLQIIISTLAFIVWAYATGGPFVATGWWKPGWAATVLAIYVIIIGNIAPGKTENGNSADQKP